MEINPSLSCKPTDSWVNRVLLGHHALSASSDACPYSAQPCYLSRPFCVSNKQENTGSLTHCNSIGPNNGSKKSHGKSLSLFHDSLYFKHGRLGPFRALKWPYQICPCLLSSFISLPFNSHNSGLVFSFFVFFSFLKNRPILTFIYPLSLLSHVNCTKESYGCHQSSLSAMK